MFEGYFAFWLNRRRFALLVLVQIGFAWVIYYNVWLIELLTGMPILDMEVGYTIERVNTLLGSYTAEARARYEIIQIADILHPAVYATLLGTIIWHLAGRRRSPLLAFPPLVTALFDWAENVMIWRMTSQNLPVDAADVQAGNILSLAKHGFLLLTLAIVLILLLRHIYLTLTM